MNVYVERGDGMDRVTVTLSERNLKTLLSKLSWPESKRTIYRVCGTMDGRERPALLTVIAENDAKHYDRPDGPPGEMHPRTEADIAG